jgi:hypothetical protein
MRRLILLALLSFAPACLAQSNPSAAAADDVLAAERLFWTNYTSANTVGLAKQFTPDFRNVEQETWTGPQVLHFVSVFFKQCTLAPVKIREPKVVFLTPTIATLTYRAPDLDQASPSCNGKSMSSACG